MSNTVITNYTDLNGPSTKADSSVVVIVNKDGSLSVDETLLGTLMGTDGSQGAGISVVRVGHEGRPDDATDSESDDDKVPHVTLTVDSYYDEPNSIIKYDSGAEMLQSLRIETRENSLLGFQNDHCYTPFTSPQETTQQGSDSYAGLDEPIIEIKHQSPPKTIPSSKKITIIEQTIIPPKGRKIVINPSDAILMKGSDVLSKKLSGKAKQVNETAKAPQISDESEESSLSSSEESIQDRESDSDYKDTKDKSGSVRKSKLKPRILKNQAAKASRLEPKAASRTKARKAQRKDIKDKLLRKSLSIESQLREFEQPRSKETQDASIEQKKEKPIPKAVKKEKKTPAHVTALLSDMTSLFSTPDVIRRVSTDNKTPTSTVAPSGKKDVEDLNKDKAKKSYVKQKVTNPTEKATKGFDLIPQIDDASLAQILQDTTGISTAPVKNQPTITTTNAINSPGLAGPLSPTLDLLASLQPEEEGLTEDLLMHVAQLVESSEHLQEVIDKQVLGKVDTVPPKAAVSSPFQQAQNVGDLYTPSKSVKTMVPRKDPIEIVRRDGRVITLPPIEAPATRASKRKSQMESASTSDVLLTPPTQPIPPPQPPPQTVASPPEPLVTPISKQYINKKMVPKKQETVLQPLAVEKALGESQDSWNSEDDPNRLWCICRQPHNNRFMICCDGCEDWFHGKCVNITKIMGQQMEEQGIEWRCPNCIKKPKTLRTTPKEIKKREGIDDAGGMRRQSGDMRSPKTSCIVCKKPARASSIYCSDACILKHAQDALIAQALPIKMGSEPGKEKLKAESRVIVFERKTGRCLAGINAPTAENLKAWLQRNPTFEVVRPETLNAIKPKFPPKKGQGPEPRRLQTTLNFERVPKKVQAQPVPVRSPQPGLVRVESTTPKMGPSKPPTPKLLTPKTLTPTTPTTPRTPSTPKVHPFFDTPKASTSRAGPSGEAKKPVKAAPKLQPNLERPLVTPAARRKEVQTPRKMDSDNDSIRENVRKALHEQISARMNENTGKNKFSEKEIKQFANETETELHELFRDVGVKYKAKYRSLMFNIKDRKNLSLWQKICDKAITPKDLVRLSPEELASQELAEWRDQESKHQLELIKKSELDLLAASKTYVLKTHKGEEVMETKTAVSTELDPDVPIEDVVSALNDSTLGEDPAAEGALDTSVRKLSSDSGDKHSRKRGREDSDSHKKSKRDSKRDSDRKRSKSSRKRSDSKQREERPRRSGRRSDRVRSPSRERSKVETSTEKVDSRSSRRRSRSRGKGKRRSKSREHSRSRSQGGDRSDSRERSKRRSRSRDTRRKQRSRSKHRPSQEDKVVQRSRSQENTYSKSKNDSTDSDSVERPKSAMMKEVHPEYDPHEPMITSANSEEDLRKTGEDVYGESFKADALEIGDIEFDSSKTFTIDSDIVLPKYPEKRDKPSEVESDQEPSSTVDNAAATVWNGCINMVDVARFYVAAHEVSGISNDLEEDLSAELDIVGRINPDTVWDYINKMKRTGNKDIVVLRLQAANDEEKMQYIALYSYLSSRNRLGVVKVSNTTTVKDFYILPLSSNAALPKVLLPLDGPGLDEAKNHLLIAIIIRQRKKRAAANIPKDIIPAKVARGSRKRSYTPPPAPVAAVAAAAALAHPPYTSPALSTSVKDKIAASLAAADEDEAYSPGSSSNESASAAPSDTLRSKMEELNRQIEEQKQQIMKIAHGDSAGAAAAEEDEAYSPSRPMTPSPPANPLAGIALPSNLQEILATIKQRSETAATAATAAATAATATAAAAGDVDMRTMPS